jgi:solute carrier family 6 serotonin transporter-like protein 4
LLIERIIYCVIGLDSTFGGLEAIITGLCDEYPNVLKRHRELFVAGLVAVIYILSLPTTTYVRNNIYILFFIQ